MGNNRAERTNSSQAEDMDFLDAARTICPDMDFGTFSDFMVANPVEARNMIVKAAGKLKPAKPGQGS